MRTSSRCRRPRCSRDRQILRRRATPNIPTLPRKGILRHSLLVQTAPLAVTTGIGLEQHDHEGRVLTLEYPGFYLVNCYTPNSQDGLKRLDYRMEWEDAFRAYLLALDAKKPVILCGDLNVAHTEMDIKTPRPTA